MAETDVNVQLTGLKKDIENVTNLNARLDTAIEKLTFLVDVTYIYVGHIMPTPPSLHVSLHPCGGHYAARPRTIAVRAPRASVLSYILTRAPIPQKRTSTRSRPVPQNEDAIRIPTQTCNLPTRLR